MNFMFLYQAYTDVEDFEDEEEQEVIDDYIEKEHEDYKLQPSLTKVKDPHSGQPQAIEKNLQQTIFIPTY